MRDKPYRYTFDIYFKISEMEGAKEVFDRINKYMADFNPETKIGATAPVTQVVVNSNKRMTEKMLPLMIKALKESFAGIPYFSDVKLNGELSDYISDDKSREENKPVEQGKVRADKAV